MKTYIHPHFIIYILGVLMGAAIVGMVWLCIAANTFLILAAILGVGFLLSLCAPDLHED